MGCQNLNWASTISISVSVSIFPSSSSSIFSPPCAEVRRHMCSAGLSSVCKNNTPPVWCHLGCILEQRPRRQHAYRHIISVLGHKIISDKPSSRAEQSARCANCCSACSPIPRMFCSPNSFHGRPLTRLQNPHVASSSRHTARRMCHHGHRPKKRDVSVVHLPDTVGLSSGPITWVLPGFFNLGPILRPHGRIPCPVSRLCCPTAIFDRRRNILQYPAKQLPVGFLDKAWNHQHIQADPSDS